MLDIIIIIGFFLILISTFFYRFMVVKKYIQPMLFYTWLAIPAYLALFTNEIVLLGPMRGNISPKDFPVLCRSIGLIEAVIVIYGFTQIIKRIKKQKKDVKLK